MITLDQILAKYQIDASKENFPVNTIRIIYLILIETLAENPQEKCHQLIEILPNIGVVAKASKDNTTNSEKTLKQLWTEIRGDLDLISKAVPQTSFEDILAIYSSVSSNATHQLTFSLINAGADPNYSYSLQDLIDTLYLRADDSVIYSQLVCDLIQKKEHRLNIHAVINLVYQYNDLMDAIVFAKEDTESNNFSPVEIIRRASQNSNEGKKMIKAVLDTLDTRRKTIELPAETMSVINEFINKLTSVIGPIDVEEEKSA